MCADRTPSRNVTLPTPRGMSASLFPRSSLFLSRWTVKERAKKWRLNAAVEASESVMGRIHTQSTPLKTELAIVEGEGLDRPSQNQSRLCEMVHSRSGSPSHPAVTIVADSAQQQLSGNVKRCRMPKHSHYQQMSKGPLTWCMRSECVPTCRCLTRALIASRACASPKRLRVQRCR